MPAVAVLPRSALLCEWLMLEGGCDRSSASLDGRDCGVAGTGGGTAFDSASCSSSVSVSDGIRIPKLCMAASCTSVMSFFHRLRVVGAGVGLDEASLSLFTRVSRPP